MSVIGSIIKKVSEIHKEFGEASYFYYRGQQSTHSLLPSILRSNITTVQENNLYCDSWVMGGKELAASRNSWEVLAQLQHFGIPTRLLDWSSSLISALYFSVNSCSNCKKKDCCNEDESKEVNCNGSPCLWILDPSKMHFHFHEDDKLITDRYAITIGIDDFAEFDDYFIKINDDEWPHNGGPIFIEVPWLSSRIQSQKGYFTFHPTADDISKLDSLDRDLFCRKVEIKHEDVPKILNELKVIGITDYDIYPDLSALGSQLKKKFSC
jgi:hypothetical protein